MHCSKPQVNAETRVAGEIFGRKKRVGFQAAEPLLQGHKTWAQRF